MRFLFSSFAIFSGIASLLFLSGCNHESPRHYTEIAFHEKSGPMATLEAPIQISWTLPRGWVEQPGGDPLRVAGFLAPDSSATQSGVMDDKSLDVSIVQFEGNAGGLSANIARWMGQLKIPPTPDLVQNIIAHADSLSVATGQKGIIIDFTNVLAGDMTHNTSIIGAIVSGNDYTVFIKAKGDRDQLLKLRTQIIGFCKSVSITEDKP